MQLLTRSRFGLSHLREHKFKYNFHDIFTPICNCGDSSSNANTLNATIDFLIETKRFDEKLFLK